MSEVNKATARNALFKYDTAMRIIRTLREAGFDGLFAGGSVRDLLLRERPKDYDIATNAKPEDVKKLFEKTVPLGEEYGVTNVLLFGQQMEVATFRADMEYEDGRRPKGVQFAGAKEDALRRDFTINGMFYDPIEGEFLDHVMGVRDIDKKLVRAIGDPERRFAEDYLRMLRAVRFASTLGFKIESETAAAIRSHAEKITKISGERTRAELEAMLVHPKRRIALNLLDETGLLAHVLPGVELMKGVKQSKREHPEGDVWRHTLLAMEKLEGEASFEVAMGVLLHDVGKPSTAAKQGERPFIDHERVGEKMAMKIAGRLKLSKRETGVIAFLVRYHMVLKDVRHMRKSKLKQVLGHELFDELAEVCRIDALASHGDLSDVEYALAIREKLGKEKISPKAFVTGDDLKGLGMEPGPAMGKVLQAVYTAQLEDEIESREAALEMAKRLMEEALRE